MDMAPRSLPGRKRDLPTSARSRDRSEAAECSHELESLGFEDLGCLRLAQSPALELRYAGIAVPEGHGVAVVEAATLLLDALCGIAACPNQPAIRIVGPGLVGSRTGVAIPKVDGIAVVPIEEIY